MIFFFLLEAWQAENILLVWSIEMTMPKSLNGWFIVKVYKDNAGREEEFQSRPMDSNQLEDRTDFHH